MTNQSSPARQADTKRLRELAEKATSGPWHSEAVMSQYPHDICLVNPIEPIEETGWPVVIASVYGDDGDEIEKAQASSTAAFIAACDPQTIIGLIDKNERLRADRAKYLQALLDVLALLDGGDEWNADLCDRIDRLATEAAKIDLADYPEATEPILPPYEG